MATQNTGQQNAKILRQRDITTTGLTGLIMPNIPMVSPQSIVANTSVITYNYPANVDPTGGSDGDIWYNPVADELFKKENGIWTLLIDRVVNVNYVSPIENTESCPAPLSPLMLSRRYSTSLATFCASSFNSVYINSNLYTDIAPGVAVFTDNGLSTPLTGYILIDNGGGTIFNLDSSTGIVGSNTGNSC